VPATAVTLAWLFWPGPLTLILRKQPWVPAEVTGGQDTVGLRVPAHPVALALLVGLGELAEAGAPCGIAAPSANRFGSLSPTTAQDVLEAWPGMLCPAADLAADGALPAGVAGCVLDGGACQVGLESTIVDLSGGAARILRPGAITAEQVASALGQPAASAGPAGDSPPRVPGSLEQHYAPRAAVVALEQDAAGAALASALLQAGRTALIAPRGWLARQAFAPGATLVALPDSLDGQAQGLYAALRTADAVSDLIGVVLPPAQGIGVAIRDRVLRAAGRGGASDAGP
jgi:L-threonylcarbamoyladenylate synthase